VKFPHFGRFGGDLNRGDGMECQGVVVWPCNFIRSQGNHPAGAYSVGYTRFKLWAGKIWG
jgi:hypothetical protein